jgi:hypothetical protein
MALARTHHNHEVGVAPHATTYSANWWVSFLVAVFTSGSLCCGSVDRESADSLACDESEHPVTSTIRDWFSLLERQAVETREIDRFLAESPIVFPLTEGGSPGPNEFPTWVSDLRSPHPQVAYRIGAIRTDSAGEDSYRVRFQLDRRALDETGFTHVARREQTWLIRDLPGVPPAVLRIDEQRSLAFSGTGPQIVCY